MFVKNARNANEDAEIKKRDGVIATGQLEYLDIRVRDDTGEIGCRIGRRDYLRIGKELLERVPVGAHLLLHAVFWNGYRYAFIQNWIWLNEIENDLLQTYQAIPWNRDYKRRNKKAQGTLTFDEPKKPASNNTRHLDSIMSSFFNNTTRNQ
jgi:hypothetical protein